MPLLGSGVLAIWNGVHPDADEDFVAWHVREHIPERVSVPGFLRGRRYVALDGAKPRYFNFYETADLAVLTSDAYTARLNAPSDWTRRVVRRFTDTSRTACRVVASRGRGEGAVVATWRIGAVAAPDAFGQRAAALVDEIVEQPGVVAAHLLRGEDRASRTDSAEKAMRAQPDEIVDWIVLIEAVGAPAIARLDAALDLRARLLRAGAPDGLAGGVYALQFSLSCADLGPADAA